jgi:hypothetical protein
VKVGSEDDEIVCVEDVLLCVSCFEELDEICVLEELVLVELKDFVLLELRTRDELGMLVFELETRPVFVDEVPAVELLIELEGKLEVFVDEIPVVELFTVDDNTLEAFEERVEITEYVDVVFLEVEAVVECVGVGELVLERHEHPLDTRDDG